MRKLKLTMQLDKLANCRKLKATDWTREYLGDSFGGVQDILQWAMFSTLRVGCLVDTFGRSIPFLLCYS